MHLELTPITLAEAKAKAKAKVSATTLQTLRQIVLKKVGARHAAGSRTNFTEWTDTTKVNVPHF